MLFEIFDDLNAEDDGTPEAADAVADIKRFTSDYFGNGRLHIYNADTGELISRKDAYIPVNMWLNAEAAEREIARWKEIANRRRERAASVDNEVIYWSDPYFISVSVAFNFDENA